MKKYNHQFSLINWGSSRVLYSQISFTARDHSFSAYKKISKKLTIPTPWYAHVRLCNRGEVGGSGGKKIFEKFCARTKWTISNYILESLPP